MLGIGTLVLELGAPLFLINRSIGRLWAIATYGMHVGIWLVMGITFEYCLLGVIFIFLFDLEKPLFAGVNWLNRIATRLYSRQRIGREREAGGGVIRY